MVAGDNPVVFLGGTGAGDGAGDVPDGAEGDVLLEMHVDGDFVGIRVIAACAEMVGEGKCALPVAWGVGSGQGFENGGGVVVGEGVRGNAGLVVLQLVGWDAFGVGEVEG